MQNRLKKGKGITLIALVVTVVVLIILAGITLTLVLGQNGVANKAKEAKNDTEQAQVKEEFQMLITEYEMNKFDNSNLSFEDYIKGKGADEVTINPDGNYDVIYGGYEFILDKNTLAILKESKAGSRPTISNVKVVTNSNGTGTNVTDGNTVVGTTLYVNFDSAIEGGTITNIEPAIPYAVTANGEYSFKVTGKVNGTECSKNYKVEVKSFITTLSDVTTVKDARDKNAIAITSNKALTDDNSKTLTIPAGFKIASDSATIVNDGIVIEDKSGNQFVWVSVDNVSNYKRTDFGKQYDSYDYYSETMPSDELTSITAYKGYYIGRYEAGDEAATALRKSGASTTNKVAIKKGKAPYSYVARAQAITLSTNMKTAQGYTTSITKLCSSYAWDTAVNFIQNKVEDYGTNSPQGNYNDNTFQYKDMSGTVQTKAQNTSTLIPTGQTIGVCNIYDMGGNATEWTTENSANSSNSCVKRGGYCILPNTSVNAPAGYRGVSPSDYAGASEMCFRITLYLQ